MELKEIRELIKLVSGSGVDEVQVERGDFKIAIKKNTNDEVHHVVSTPVSAPAAAPVAAPAPTPEPVVEAAPKAATPAVNEDNLITVKSPMIGTFYTSPSPDKPVFVKPGDEIAPGDVLCIVEAMKLFNEIESEVSGRIVKILVENATPVEYDQPLFQVEKI